MTFSDNPDFPRIGEASDSAYAIVVIRGGVAIRRRDNGAHILTCADIADAVRLAHALDTGAMLEDGSAGEPMGRCQ